MAHILPAEALAEQHKKMAAPGTAQKSPKPSRGGVPAASLMPSPLATPEEPPVSPPTSPSTSTDDHSPLGSAP